MSEAVDAKEHYVMSLNHEDLELLARKLGLIGRNQQKTRRDLREMIFGDEDLKLRKLIENTETNRSLRLWIYNMGIREPVDREVAISLVSYFMGDEILNEHQAQIENLRKDVFKSFSELHQGYVDEPNFDEESTKFALDARKDAIEEIRDRYGDRKAAAKERVAGNHGSDDFAEIYRELDATDKWIATKTSATVTSEPHHQIDASIVQSVDFTQDWRWKLFITPGKIILWWEYYFPQRGNVWASGRRKDNPLIELIYASIFWFVIIGGFGFLLLASAGVFRK